MRSAGVGGGGDLFLPLGELGRADREPVEEPSISSPDNPTDT